MRRVLADPLPIRFAPHVREYINRVAERHGVYAADVVRCTVGNWMELREQTADFGPVEPYDIEDYIAECAPDEETARSGGPAREVGDVG